MEGQLNPTPLLHTLRHTCLFGLLLLTATLLGGCQADTPPMGSLSQPRDSAPLMTTYGLSKLISDSGYMRYRFIAEEWRLYDRTKPPRWEFPKGLFVERYNNRFEADFYAQADTAWLYNQRTLRMKGRVYVEDRAAGTRLWTEELFWDFKGGTLHSNRHTTLREPQREIEGDRFTAKMSGQQPTQYHIWQSKGYMPKPAEHKPGTEQPASPPTTGDTTATH